MALIGAKLTVKYSSSKIIKNFEQLQTRALQDAIFRWETEAKLLTTLENHIVTGRYRASINNNNQDGFAHPTVAVSEGDDGIHQVVKYNEIVAGSNVKYAAKLEQRYSIMLRALDNAKQKMLKSYSDRLIKGL